MSTSKLEWNEGDAQLGDFAAADGVRFSILYQPTCYRRGPWRLLIEIESYDHTWGCFDEHDQPMRYYHSEERLVAEAQAIADVLVRDHENASSRKQGGA